MKPNVCVVKSMYLFLKKREINQEKNGRKNVDIFMFSKRLQFVCYTVGKVNFLSDKSTQFWRNLIET